MSLEDILDSLPDSQERTRRKLLFTRAFDGDVSSRKTLKNDYSLTYIYNKDRGEVRL